MLIVFVLVVPESPKQLYMKGETEKAIASMTAIARFNGAAKPVEWGKS